MVAHALFQPEQRLLPVPLISSPVCSSVPLCIRTISLVAVSTLEYAFVIHVSVICLYQWHIRRAFFSFFRFFPHAMAMPVKPETTPRLAPPVSITAAAVFL